MKVSVSEKDGLDTAALQASLRQQEKANQRLQKDLQVHFCWHTVFNVVQQKVDEIASLRERLSSGDFNSTTTKVSSVKL